MKRFSFALACFLLLASSALAGVVDSPLPELLAGETTYHVYSVPGVRDTGGFGLGTFFSCTSLESAATIQIGVEGFFNAGGPPVNDAVARSVNIAPGQSVSFATHMFIGGLSAQVDLGLGLMSHGSARILATSKKIMCTAFLADNTNMPPTSMTYLTIIAKTKQKAAN